MDLSTAGQLTWINLLLSSGGAVVVGLACRSLAPQERKIGILFGAIVVALTPVLVAVAGLPALPYLKLIGGLALLWIATELLITGATHGERPSLGQPFRIVLIAALAISLDGAIAAAIARAEILAVVLALAASVVVVALGAALLTGLFNRLPILAWAGAALVGWIAGAIISKDAALAAALNPFVTSAASALIVIMVAERLNHLGAMHSGSPSVKPAPELRKAREIMRRW